MSKISELSDGGSLVSSDYLIAVRSGGNVKVRMDQINVDQIDLGDNEFIRLGNSQDLTIVHNASNSIINQAGIGNLLIQKAGTTKASITANGLEFPDNSKAIFGAGSDLQIGHDGSVSFITDSGTGDLYIQGSSAIRLTNPAGNETFAVFNDNGAASLYYDNGVSLSTTASGIDVTGSVTSGAHLINAASTAFGASSVQGFNTDFLVDAGQGYARHNSYHTGGSNHQFLVNEASSTTNAVAFSIAKDKSATFNGNVGIGTTSPTAPLTVNGTNAGIRFTDAGQDPTNYYGEIYKDYNGNALFVVQSKSNGNGVIALNPDGGNVGIGTSSVSSVLSVKSDVSNDVNNGILFEAADSTNKLLQLYENSVGECYMGFYQANVQTALIRTNGNSYFNGGNVGIGTTSPSALLQLEGSDGTPQLKFLRTGTNIGGIIRQTSNPYGLTYDAIDGNAGAPTHVFRTSVDGSSFTERLRINSAGNLILTSGGSLVAGGANDLILNAGESGTPDIYLQSGGSTKVKIEGSDGSVGIGTTSPASYYSVPLVVATSGSQGGITIANTTANQQGMLAFADGTSGSDRYSGYIDYNHNTNVMSFGTNGGLERLRIDASGSVGISNSIASSFNAGANNLVVGSGSGSEGMTIYGGAESNIFFADGTAGTAAYIGRIEYAHSSDTMRFYVNNSSAMTINSSGNLMVGGTSPSAKLIVDAGLSSGETIRADNSKASFAGVNIYSVLLGSSTNNATSRHFQGFAEGATRYVVYGNGAVYGNGTYGTYSDLKLKENIVDANSQWADIKAVQLKNYSMKEDGLSEANQLGVIAQDLEASGMQKLVEEIDDKDVDGNLLGTATKHVKYSVLHLKALGALQEAMERIESLEARIAALES